MHIHGIAAIVLVILAILMMVNVVPVTGLVVGGMFLLVAAGLGGYYYIK